MTLSMDEMAALAARGRMVRAQNIKLLGSEVKASLWEAVVMKLCVGHYTIENGKRFIPASSDVLYNLVTYSHVAMERLAYGRPYIEDWVDATHIQLRSDVSYLVLMSTGFITWGTYDNMAKKMSLRLGDCEVQISPDRLLGINKAVEDGQDFLRGVSLANFDALKHIKCDTRMVDVHIPGKVGKPTAQKRKSKQQRAARKKNK